MIDTEGNYANQECIICYNEYNMENAIIFDCNHHICVACYQRIINISDDVLCPLCRRIVDRIQEPTIQSQSIIIVKSCDLCKLFFYLILIGIMIANILLFS